MLRKLPLGIQSFKEIVTGDYLYVDKTEYIYRIMNNAKHYFLSRPRRFGKSLLLDTVAEAFSGDKELFKGLYLYASDYSFEKHPVLRIDMSGIASKDPETLENSLSDALRKRIQEEGFTISSGIPGDLFRNLIQALYTKHNQRVVVLIDEYDKPILDHLDDPDMADANRRVLKGFYGILKSMDPFLRMTFITGVTKFSKTSIFSELNNLYDITMTEKYANICGIAIDDLGKYFSEHIGSLAELDRFKRYSNLQDEILMWYDGYSWDGKTRVINPFSLLSFFMQERFSGFWYASGTPDFLIKLIKERPSSFLALKDLEISERLLDLFDIRKMSAEPLLFQSGYLTVEERRLRGDSESYLLKVPNYEVREAFYLQVITEFTESDGVFAETAYWKIKDSLHSGNLQSMLDLLKGLFASIPYQLHINCEAYYHSIFLALMNVLGFDTDAEVQTARGRIDAVLELADKVYIMEFKYRGCTPDISPEAKQRLFVEALDEGLAQIKSRGYAKKYAGGGKAVYLAAFAFLGRDDIDMRMEFDKAGRG